MLRATPIRSAYASELVGLYDWPRSNAAARLVSCSLRSVLRLLLEKTGGESTASARTRACLPLAPRAASAGDQPEEREQLSSVPSMSPSVAQ